MLQQQRFENTSAKTPPCRRFRLGSWTETDLPPLLFITGPGAWLGAVLPARQSAAQTARDVREGGGYTLAVGRRCALSQAVRRAGPVSEASSEEFPGTIEPVEASADVRKQKPPRRRRRRCVDSFAICVHGVLSNFHQGLSLSRGPVSATVTCRDLQDALHLLLPGGLGKHAASEATEALLRVTSGKGTAWAPAEHRTPKALFRATSPVTERPVAPNGPSSLAFEPVAFC